MNEQFKIHILDPGSNGEVVIMKQHSVRPKFAFGLMIQHYLLNSGKLGGCLKSQINIMV